MNTDNAKPLLQAVLQEFQDCADLDHRTFPDVEIELIYFGHLIGALEFERDVVTPLSNIKADEVSELLKRKQYVEVNESRQLVKKILAGCVALFHRGRAYVVNVYRPESRSVDESETESVIVGPHDAFVEIAAVNLSLLRRRVNSSRLKVLNFGVGEVTKTDVYLLYVEGIANRDYIDEMIGRVQDVEIDAVYDGNMLVQYIDDAPNSIFPQFPTTERVDVAASRLVGGKVVVIVDGSPSVISGPASFFEFFSSPDDYYQRWALGTAVRLLRFAAFFITILFTSMYVSATTFHYEMIPEDLLLTLAESRSRVPFPPLIEALLMELTIELLREAGARLPSKIGQTIGIVGGIVIGQAAVQAGFTSNVLIISVASSAIASFVIPSYVMSASIRLIRFGLIFLAGIFGNFGIMIGVAMTVIHLSGLTSLRSSYMTPIAPFNPKDWRDVVVRAPFWALTDRPSQSKSPNPIKNKMRK